MGNPNSRMSLDLTDRVRKALEKMKKTGPSFNRYIAIATEEKLLRDGYLKKGK